MISASWTWTQARDRDKPGGIWRFFECCSYFVDQWIQGRCVTIMVWYIYIWLYMLILIRNIPFVVGELCWYCQNSIMIGQYPLGPPSFFDMFCWSYWYPKRPPCRGCLSPWWRGWATSPSRCGPKSAALQFHRASRATRGPARCVAGRARSHRGALLYLLIVVGTTMQKL